MALFEQLLCQQLNFVTNDHGCIPHVVRLPVLSSLMTYYRVCCKSNTTSVTSRAGTYYPSGAPEFTPGFLGVRVARFLVFCVVFCRSSLVILSFFFWPLFCLSFLDLPILITPLESETKNEFSNMINDIYIFDMEKH